MNNQSRASACANHLRSLGLTPLPSRSDDKIPALDKYTHFYAGEPVPDGVYDEWNAVNMQVITGTQHPGRTSVVVVDLDGDEAPDTWKNICDHNNYEVTSPWVARTGSGGTHIWYRAPSGLLACPTGILWGVYDTWGDSGLGGWVKHNEIRLLADRALAMAPPSIHPKTGERYRFYPGASPNHIYLPEVAPAWLLAMPRLVAPRFRVADAAPVIRPPEKLSGRHYMRNEVMAAITDKVSLIRSWGLKVDRTEPNASGWVPCFVPWREVPGQSRASGSFHAADGTFQDRKDGACISFFDLAATLQPGMFPTWMDCRDYCGDRFIGRISRT